MEQEYLKLKKSNCKNCYKCIRNCPVKSIKFLDDQAYILESDCILCGNCFVNCPQDAKVIRKERQIIQKMAKKELTAKVDKTTKNLNLTRDILFPPTLSLEFKFSVSAPFNEVYPPFSK